MLVGLLCGVTQWSDPSHIASHRQTHPHLKIQAAQFNSEQRAYHAAQIIQLYSILSNLRVKENTFTAHVDNKTLNG